MPRVRDDALYKGEQVYVKVINREIYSRLEKGNANVWTVDDTSRTEPMWLNGKRTVKIHWNSSNVRYSIIHLNEFGTVNNPNPPRKGAIAKALRAGEAEYKAVIRNALEGAL